jgi:hypothetical protein
MTKKRFYSESELVFKEKPTDQRFHDLTGQRFGSMVVIGFAGNTPQSRWYCKCDCETIKNVWAMSLKNGQTKSCGCLQKSIVRGNNLKHGHAVRYKKTNIYSVWNAMIQRCTNPNTKHYSDYGGRGIKVCERWRHSFENFLADMGECPKGLTLERKENNGNYEQSNCKWATTIDQANNKRNSRIITYQGKKLSARQWDRELGLVLGTTWSRIFVLGWSKQRALNKNE